MFTFGFVWKPWLSSYVISPKKEILEYLNEAVDENGLRSKIRFGCNVERASFSSATCEWSIQYRDATGGTTVVVSSERDLFFLGCTQLETYGFRSRPWCTAFAFSISCDRLLQL